MGKVIFLVQHLAQPRCIKRILSVKDAGFEVEVHGFDRGNYSGNIRQLTEHGIEIKTLIQSKELSKTKKLLAYASMVKKVARKKAKGDIIYAFGFEMSTFTRLLTRAKYVYECGDVVAAREHNKVFLKLDQRNINKSAFTVFTSEGFAEYFWGESRYNPEIKEKYVLLPNKVNSCFKNCERPAVKYVNQQKIRFGFVGLFRFLKIYLHFCELIGEEHPNYEFHFWGDADEGDKERVRLITEKYSNVFLHGVFSNPQDLAKVYDSFDVSVGCYGIGSGNVKIAEPNKLYESIYFNKPIVVSNSTFLGRKVEKMNVGWAIDATHDGIKAFLDEISVERINTIMDNEKCINTEELIDDTKELCNKLSLIMDSI